MNTIIQNFKDHLPETMYLGDQNFPVSVTKSLLLPLARTESTENGLNIVDEVNKLKITQKYSGNKCTIYFYDISGGNPELVVEYEAGRRTKPKIAKAEAGTKQFSNSPKMYAGKLKSDLEAVYSDRDIKNMVNDIADMNPNEQIQEMDSILTDCELPIDPVTVYDALTFFNVLITPEKFYTMYEEIHNEKATKEDMNSIEALFRNYTINGTAKKMKRFSSRNVHKYTKQFSDDGTENPDEAVETNVDEENTIDMVDCSSEDEICDDCSEGDPDSVKEHGVIQTAGSLLGVNKIVRNAQNARDNKAIGEAKARKDLMKHDLEMQKEREKTKQIKEQEKTKREVAKAASGEDELYLEGDPDNIKEHGLGGAIAGGAASAGAGAALGHFAGKAIGKAVGGKAGKKVGKAIGAGVGALAGAGSYAAAKGIKAAKKKKAAEARGYNKTLKAAGYSGEDEIPDDQINETEETELIVSENSNSFSAKCIKAFSENNSLSEEISEVDDENVEEMCDSGVKNNSDCDCEVCPVCGNNPCTCATKQHSYKNVHNFTKSC